MIPWDEVGVCPITLCVTIQCGGERGLFRREIKLCRCNFERQGCRRDYWWAAVCLGNIQLEKKGEMAESLWSRENL